MRSFFLKVLFERSIILHGTFPHPLLTFPPFDLLRWGRVVVREIRRKKQGGTIAILALFNRLLSLTNFRWELNYVLCYVSL
ncbi:uncharacterized protein VTP21DRAFT_3102 [Calcarisporiella thermophila]|uniref:uncharacterized protein n=1 Tax=Calcarisporiella thermophila TaxID=911321 RepID=UPI003744A216